MACAWFLLLLLGVSCAVPITPEVVEEVDADGWVERVQELYVKAASNPPTPSTKWCPNSDYYEFLPLHLSSLSSTSGKAEWEGDCFKKNSAWLEVNEKGGVIYLNSTHPSHFLCSDAYLFASRQGLIFHEKVVYGLTAIKIAAWKEGELEGIQREGLGVYLLPCGALGTAKSVLKTVSLFDSKTVATNNVDFFAKKMNWVLKPFNQFNIVDEKYIRSGDYLAILRLDGLDPMIAWGTGGRTGHSATLLWQGKDLFVVEITDKNPFGNDKWPPPFGAIKTPYRQWMAQAHAAGMLVCILPLRSDLADVFDENKAWAFFNSVQGTPYGYSNFLYTVLDTYPFRNLPQPIDDGLFALLMNNLDRLINALPKFVQPLFKQLSVYSLIIEGLNHRLGADCKDMKCVNQVLDANNLSLGQAVVTPEHDDWVYGQNKTLSMVCSVICMHVWNAGLSGHIPAPIHATEQTPKDNYQLAIFDPDRFTAENCGPGLLHTPNGSVCQVTGAYVLELNDYNSVPLYAEMNDHCPAQWPDYFRCPADNPKCC